MLGIMSTLSAFYSSRLWKYGYFLFWVVFLVWALFELPEKRGADASFPLRNVIFALLMMALHVSSSWLREGRFRTWFGVLISVTLIGFSGYTLIHPFSPGQTVFFVVFVGLGCWWAFSRPTKTGEVQDA